MVQSIEASLAQLLGYTSQQSAEASAAELLALVQQFNAAGGVLPFGRSATKVVTHPAASALRQAQADYVLGGPDINAAIAAAGAGKVELTEGDFDIASPVLGAATTTLKGQGWATVLTAIANLNDYMIHGSAVADFFVSAMKLDGNKANQSSPANKYVVFLDNCDRARVEDLWVADACHMAVRVDNGSDEARVERNRITGATSDGIKVIGSSGVHIIRNYVEAADDAIALTASNSDVLGGLIQRNTVKGARGIKLNVVDNTSGYIYDVEISGNRVFDVTNTYSIVLLVTTSTGATGKIVGTTIMGNRIYNTKSTAIQTFENVEILNVIANIIRGHSGDNAGGISLSGVIDGLVELNQIYDIGIYQAINVGYYTGTTGPCADVRVADNLVDSLGTAKGINIANGAVDTDLGPNTLKNVTTPISDAGTRTRRAARKENSGTSSGTGAQQTIAHGLAETPTRVYLSNIEAAANAYQSAPADATNIYILAGSGLDYVWKAEVV